MKKLIITILILTGISFVTTLHAARFDWSFGKPAITDDNDNTTHGTRYDWSFGKPAITREAPATPPSVRRIMDIE